MGTFLAHFGWIIVSIGTSYISVSLGRGKLHGCTSMGLAISLRHGRIIVELPDNRRNPRRKTDGHEEGHDFDTVVLPRL